MTDFNPPDDPRCECCDGTDLDSEGTCAKCGFGECGRCSGEEREPDYDAPSFAETHEVAWMQKRMAR